MVWSHETTLSKLNIFQSDVRKVYLNLLCFLLASHYIILIPPFSHSVPMNLHSHRALCRNSAHLARRNFPLCRRRRCELKADAKPIELRSPSNFSIICIDGITVGPSEAEYHKSLADSEEGASAGLG
jgi:hypothetical protein